MSHKLHGICEQCGQRTTLHKHRIRFSDGDTGRNIALVCSPCEADAKAGKIRVALLRIGANEREDREYAGCMDHAAYARGASGAMRQIRDG